MLRRVLALPHGRRLDVVEVGDPHGRPVLLFHGTPGGPLEVCGCEDDARRARVRLLCAGRPGYADTSSAPPSLRTVVDDTRFLLGDLGVERIGCLGVSGGGPYAAAVAASLTGQATGLALLAGVGPAELTQWDDEPDDQEERRAVELARSGHSEEAATVIRDLVARWVTEVVADPAGPVPADIRTAILDGARHGHDGPVFDRLTTAVGWDVDVDTVACPTTLRYGAADTAVPPAHGRWYEARIPQAALTVVPGADHPGTIRPAFATVLPWLADLP